jgi:hypothetical protein
MHCKARNLLLFVALFSTACVEDTGMNEPESDDASLDSSTSNVGAQDAAGNNDASSLPDTTLWPDASLGQDASVNQDASVGDASRSDGSTGGDDAAAAPTFTWVHEILKTNCMPCHVTDFQGLLNFNGSQNSTYMALVGTAARARECYGKGTRVVAIEPDMSLLIRKLEGTAGCGDPMPKGLAPFSAALISEIRAWIAAGALNN